MEQFTNLINSLGFPITCVIALGYFVYQLFKSSREDNKELVGQYRSDVDKLISNNAQLAEALNTASETQKLIYDRMDKIETKVDNIDDKIDKVIK